MASPDFTPYIDLTPLDIDPAAIYTGAIELARLTLPEFTLRQGTPEDAIFQAMSFMSGLSVGAINRLPSRLMVGVANLLGYVKFQGTRATVEATVTLATFDAATIPQGTIFAWNFEDESGEPFQYAFELTEALEIPAGTEPTLPSGTASLRSVTPGFLPTIASGTELVVITTNTSIGSVITTNSFSNGEDPENDVEYLSSLTTYLTSLSSTISTANQAQASVLSTFRDVGRCKAYDLTDPSGDLFINDPIEPGYATIFVYGRGRQMTLTERSNIQSFLESKISSSIVQDVLEFKLCDVGVRASIAFDNSYVESEVQAAIESTLLRYLSPDIFPNYDSQIRPSTILAQISRIPGVLYVNSIYLRPISDDYQEKQWNDVLVATTGPLTLSTGLVIGATIDGVQVFGGDRILVKDQSTLSQNGIYEITGGAPARVVDANETTDFYENKLVYVISGTTNADTHWKQTTSSAVTVGTTDIEFASSAPSSSLNFTYKGSLPDINSDNIALTLTGETV